jgi:hypothetical protein
MGADVLSISMLVLRTQPSESIGNWPCHFLKQRTGTVGNAGRSSNDANSSSEISRFPIPLRPGFAQSRASTEQHEGPRAHVGDFDLCLQHRHPNTAPALSATGSVSSAIEGNLKFIPHERTSEGEKSNPADPLMNSE